MNHAGSTKSKNSIGGNMRKNKRTYTVVLDGRDYRFSNDAEVARKFYDELVKWYGMARVRIKIEEAA